MTKKIHCILLALILLAGCGKNILSPTPTLIPTRIADTPPSPSFTPTPELAPPPTAIIAPTLPPQPTATPDTRLPPEQWQEWPVVPSITGRAMEIYQQGLAMGNNPHAFSKTGDCQNIKDAFMGFFDMPDRYNLGIDYQYLQETIDNFAGYFNTDGQAVRGGFNAATVLSPLWADPKVCLPGENPLDCELRLTKPIIVFVSFEVWWEGRTTETYEKYMRQVLDTIIAHGAVPILATKADNVEGDHSLNLTTARLAHEYDLPLWNFWLAVQNLPNHGLDPVRNDGFHISTDAWNVRSFTGLQTLDNIWHGLRDSAIVAGPTPIPSLANPTEMSGLLPTPLYGPNLADGTNWIVFGMASRKGNGYQYKGIYLFDLETRKTAQILGDGFNFQSGSPDGHFLLVNHGSSLFITDGSSLNLLTETFYGEGKLGALWLPDGRIVIIKCEDGVNSIVIMQSDGTVVMNLSTENANPIELMRFTDGIHISWESGSCSDYEVCDRQASWATDIQSGQSIPLYDYLNPIISPDGTMFAYMSQQENNRSNLAFSWNDGAPYRQFPLLGDVLSDFAWAPAGTWLAVTMSIRSDYSGRITDLVNFLMDVKTLTTYQLPSTLLLIPHVLWSPNASELAYLGTDWQDNSYLIRIQEVPIDTKSLHDYTQSLNLTSTDYIFVTNAAWLTNP